MTAASMLIREKVRFLIVSVSHIRKLRIVVISTLKQPWRGMNWLQMGYCGINPEHMEAEDNREWFAAANQKRILGKSSSPVRLMRPVLNGCIIVWECSADCPSLSNDEQWERRAELSWLTINTMGYKEMISFGFTRVYHCYLLHQTVSDRQQQ